MWGQMLARCITHHVLAVKIVKARAELSNVELNALFENCLGVNRQPLAATLHAGVELDGERKDLDERIVQLADSAGGIAGVDRNRVLAKAAAHIDDSGGGGSNFGCRSRDDEVAQRFMLKVKVKVL